MLNLLFNWHFQTDCDDVALTTEAQVYPSIYDILTMNCLLYYTLTDKTNT